MIYRDMNRYENGKIYKIVDNGYNKCYIGSTCESLSQRMARHRHQYNSYLKGNHGKTRSFQLFDEYNIDNCKIELIENYPCENKEELRRREGHFIQTIDCVNKHIAGRTKEEWREESKEQIRETHRIYWENNKDYFKKKREENHEFYKDYNKQWKAEHKEYVADYNKKWNEENREKRAEKATCEICGTVVRKYDIKRHQLTIKCQQHIKN